MQHQQICLQRGVPEIIFLSKEILLLFYSFEIVLNFCNANLCTNRYIIIMCKYCSYCVRMSLIRLHLPIVIVLITILCLSNCSVTLANICRYRSLFCPITIFMSILMSNLLSKSFSNILLTFDHQFYSMIAAYRAYLCLFNSTNCHLSTLHHCNTWQPWRISWVQVF